MTLLAVGLGLVALGAAAGQEPPRFGAGVEIVRVEAVVLEGKGEPVAGLTAEDLEVTDHGAARPLATFEAIEAHAPPPRGASSLPGRVAAPRAAAAEERRCFPV